MGNAFTGSLADGEAADTLILSGEDTSRAETQASVPWSLFLSLGKGLGPNDRKSLHLQEHVYHTVLCLGFTSLWGPCGGESILTRPPCEVSSQPEATLKRTAQIPHGKRFH